MRCLFTVVLLLSAQPLDVRHTYRLDHALLPDPSRTNVVIGGTLPADLNICAEHPARPGVFACITAGDVRRLTIGRLNP